MRSKNPLRSELFLAVLFLVNGIIGTVVTIRTGGTFTAWFGGFMLAGGLAGFESYRLKRKFEAEMAQAAT